MKIFKNILFVICVLIIFRHIAISQDYETKKYINKSQLSIGYIIVPNETWNSFVLEYIHKSGFGGQYFTRDGYLLKYRTRKLTGIPLSIGAGRLFGIYTMNVGIDILPNSTFQLRIMVFPLIPNNIFVGCNLRLFPQPDISLKQETKKSE